MSSDVPKFRAAEKLILSGIAGGVAGCVAKTVVSPLNRVKILFQASNPEYQKYAGAGAFRAGAQIYKDSGTLGLFLGHSATLLPIKFLAYDEARHFLMPTRAQETNLRRFSAGAISGAWLVLLCVRMAFHTIHSTASGYPARPSFLHTARFIYFEGAQLNPNPTTPIKRDLFHTLPLLKFYRGFTVSLVSIIPYAGTGFLTWDYLRATLVPISPDGRRPHVTPMADLNIGALAGAVAQTVSYPFEVVRRRMQIGGLTQPGRWLRWRETVRAIRTRGGLQGFFVGLSIGYLKIVLMNACMKRILDVWATRWG
ncbi:mitochondrial carrier [Lactarius quietus]|nr:mitochondrial carrier [Lactarius quietus]